jgi:hypothetical protein
MGYVQFHLSYGSKSSLKPRVRPFAGTLIPIHGDAWFMPDWTRKNGREIIKEREKEYEALMLIFGLSEIYEDALDEYKVSNNHHESD